MATIYCRFVGVVTADGFASIGKAEKGDVYQVSEPFSIGGKRYDSGFHVVCEQSFSSKITPDESHWKAFDRVEVELYRVGGKSYNTACFPFPTYKVSGAKGYIFTGGTYHEVQQVSKDAFAANEGIFLESEEGNSSATFLVGGDGVNTSPSWWKGNTESISVLPQGSILILGPSTTSNDVGFFIPADGVTTLYPNHAYIVTNKNMADKTYIQFTGRLKATSQEGILAEAQQIAISGSDNTNVKQYIDNKISSVNNNINSVAGSVYRPKGSITFAGLKALASATAGDVYNVTDAFTLGSKSYPAGSNVACLKSFSSAVTPSETYWDVLAGFVDLSPYAKTSEVSTIKGNLEKSISDNVSTLTTKVGTAQTTANAAKSAASTNAGEITKIKTRVSSLEGVGAQANVIESVKVNGSALPISNKSVNVDLSAYTKTTELDNRINLKSESGGYKSVSIFGGAVRLSVGTDVNHQQINIGDGVVIGTNVEIRTGVKISLGGNGRLQLIGNTVKDIANVEDLAGYVQKVSGKGLSSNDYTSAEKTKLAGIASSAQVNVIESVKVNGSALAVANKAVNIDLSSYAKGSDVDRLKKMTKKFVALPFTFGIEVGTPTFESSSITINGETTVYYSKAGKTFYVQSNMKNYKSWANSAGFPGKVEYNDENILFLETTTKGLYMKTADGLVLCNQSIVSGYATTSALKAAENRITALENLLKLA
jgi:hypothetical protein